MNRHSSSEGGTQNSGAMLVCADCKGTGKLGLFGPSGLGLMSRTCSCGAKSEPLGTLWRLGGETVWELRSRHCNVAFDPECGETERMLRDVWAVVFPDEPLGDKLTSPRWKDIGFQSSDPRTDIRAGRFALDQLHYLAVIHPARTQQLVSQAAELEYFFAISCLSVTQMLVIGFDLSERVSVNPVPGSKQASVGELRNFVRFCTSSNYNSVTVLHELFVALVERLHKTWKQMRGSRECNVMQHFHEALLSVYEANSAFWKEPHDDIFEFRLLASPSSQCV